MGWWRTALEDLGLAEVRVMVTGHNGYIGTVLVRLLQHSGHEVVGFDSYLFADCTLGPDWPDIPAVRKDLRDVEPEDITGWRRSVTLPGSPTTR